MKKFYEDKLIVLTGGAGFIGSCVLKCLNEMGITNIILVDDLGSTEKWKNLVGKSFVDLIDIDDLFKWLNGRESEIKGFIHLGECSNVVEKDVDYLFKRNYHFSVKLADYALTNEHRFIYASSATTYGDGAQGFSDDHARLEELKPLSAYAYSKHLFDLWIKKQGVLNLAVGLKYFNVFGPNEYHKDLMASPLLHFVPQALEENTIRLFKSNDTDKFADGEQCRDFIYVKDVARMTCDFLFSSIGGIFNIGRGQPVTWNELANAIIEALDMPVSIEYINMAEEFVGQYQSYTCADMSKYVSYASKAKIDTSTMNLKPAVNEYIREYILPGKRW